MQSLEKLNPNLILMKETLQIVIIYLLNDELGGHQLRYKTMNLAKVFSMKKMQT